ncbi:phosphopentomutase [Brevibacillus massiliensis]|jgi:phosphopentomutase|uniref:phosphopentomutase n=1 Tax=Brevibacillus massiliensis TaxID=1118054 RepID=UPI00030560F0|nr:phosphopentomutase [Brevibacillus massiliensis]
MSRTVVVILDGLGVGEMPDVAEVRKQDVGSHTLGHLLEKRPTRLPVLSKLGLAKILRNSALLPEVEPVSSYGVCRLAHDGADTYAGHNEIMGAKPKVPVKMFMIDVAEEVEAALLEAGFPVSRPISETGVLLVDGKIIVADNMETDPGQIINVTGPLDEVPFAKILKVGQVVRQIVKTSRVIALGGTGVTARDIINSCITRNRQCGVDTPRLNIYNENYQVRHLGYGINPETQIPSILQRSGIPVYLYGKIADVVQGDVEERDPVVQTAGVFERILSRLDVLKHGLICATVQETDLAGHEQDCEKYARVLEISDRGIGQIIDRLEPGDLLIVTADHGNDPTIGHSGHTRECTPLMVYRRGENKTTELGVRDTLADVAATIADYFQAASPEYGTSIWAGSR